MDMTQTKAASPGSNASAHPALRLAGAVHSATTQSCDPQLLEHLLTEARELLSTLKVDKSRIEARLAEFGRTDPITEVKGYSALDEAISACQQAIQTLDDSLLGTEPDASA